MACFLSIRVCVSSKRSMSKTVFGSCSSERNKTKIQDRKYVYNANKRASIWPSRMKQKNTHTHGISNEREMKIIITVIMMMGQVFFYLLFGKFHFYILPLSLSNSLILSPSPFFPVRLKEKENLPFGHFWFL